MIYCTSQSDQSNVSKLNLLSTFFHVFHLSVFVSGKELIQSSGDRPRLLVARSDWMAKAIQTEC